MKSYSKQSMISFRTIYRWLYLGLIKRCSVDVLHQKGKRRKPTETRGRFNVGKSIHSRPKEVKKRETFGHWEFDTVVSSRGKSKACMATFAERKTRLALKMPDSSASSMEHVIQILTSVVSKRNIQNGYCR
jgi:IS30 family transposase